MIDQADYIQAFSHYLRSGDASLMRPYLRDTDNSAFLAIYRNGFYKACLSALKANFVSLNHVLDESQFDALAIQYIDLYPPVQGTLVAYGMEESLVAQSAQHSLSFPAFYKQESNKPLSKSQLKAGLYDLLLLDQAWFSTLNKGQQPCVELEQIQSMVAQGQDLSAMPFQLVDCAILVELDYGQFNAWKDIRFFNQHPVLSDKEATEFVLFWQARGEVKAQLLSPLEHHFYASFKDSKSMNYGFEVVTGQDENFDVAALFADLLNASLLTLEA